MGEMGVRSCNETFSSNRLKPTPGIAGCSSKPLGPGAAELGRYCDTRLQVVLLKNLGQALLTRLQPNTVEHLRCDPITLALVRLDRGA
jgi:hypothetical protein